MNNIKVSVVVPVYKVEPYIHRCLDSILSQTYDNLEVLFVDDCGTDNSVQIIQSFIQSHPEMDLKVIHHDRNRGLSAARNTGLSVANGDYVYFYDSDDVITSECIASLVAPLAYKSYDFIVGDYMINGDILGTSDLVLGEGEIMDDDVLKSYSQGLWYVMAWNKLCNVDFLKQNQLDFKEGLIHEDVLWSFKLACKAKSMYVVKKKIYDYIVRPSSIMTGMSIQKDANKYVEVFANIREFVIRENLHTNSYVYNLYEGKRCGILYSLLYKGEVNLFRDVYNNFSLLVYINPVKAFIKGVIGVKELIRDIHYCLPLGLGASYKKCFYQLYYNKGNHKIEGLVWK